MKVSNVYCSPESNGRVSYILTFGKQFYLEDILGSNNAKLFIKKGSGSFELSFKPINIKSKTCCILAWKSYPVISYLDRGKSLEYLMFNSPGKYFLMFGEVSTMFFKDNTWYEEIFFPEDSKISLSILLYKSHFLKCDFQKLIFTNSVLNQVNEGNNEFIMYNNLIKSRGYWIKGISRYNIYNIFD